MHAVLLTIVAVFSVSMYLSFLMWKHSKRYFSLWPTENPLQSSFSSTLLAGVLLFFSSGVEDINGFVLMATLPILSVVLTATLIVICNLFRKVSR